MLNELFGQKKLFNFHCSVNFCSQVGSPLDKGASLSFDTAIKVDAAINLFGTKAEGLHVFAVGTVKAASEQRERLVG